MGYEPVTYKDGLSFAMGHDIIPGMPKPVSLTLKKGLAKSGDYLQKWIETTFYESEP